MSFINIWILQNCGNGRVDSILWTVHVWVCVCMRVCEVRNIMNDLSIVCECLTHHFRFLARFTPIITEAIMQQARFTWMMQDSWGKIPVSEVDVGSAMESLNKWNSCPEFGAQEEFEQVYAWGVTNWTSWWRSVISAWDNVKKMYFVYWMVYRERCIENYILHERLTSPNG